MTSPDFFPLLPAAAGLFGLFAILWHFQWRRQDATLVDAGWAYSLGALVAYYAFAADGDLWRRSLYAGLMGLWALRLGTYLLRTRVLAPGHGEDRRYRALRDHWGQRADPLFFVFFQFQGLANLVLSAPILLIVQTPRPGLTLWDAFAAVIVVASVAGERVADNQLHAWKSRPENLGRTCRQGLWRYSRHPNYFFEWCHWLAYPVAGLNLLGTPWAAWWFFTLLGPVAMYLILVHGTGIPFAEQQAVQHRGEDYRRYQRETSRFFPWWPRNGGTSPNA